MKTFIQTFQRREAGYEENTKKAPTIRCPFFVILYLAAFAIPFSVATLDKALAAEFSVSNVTEFIAAINAANDETNHPGPDTIKMTKGTYTLTKVDNDTDGPNGLPSITSEITINGNESIIERSDVEETPEFRIFHVSRLDF